MTNFTITIDGPAGAGKSTVAKKVADKLGFLYIDTGAMYRAVTYAALEQKIDFADEQSLVSLTKDLEITLLRDDENKLRVLLNNKDVSEQIRSPLVSAKVSLVAKVQGVRKELVLKQRSMAAFGGVVMEGRDIGTNVLPKAKYKFFLTASVLERAKRRYKELLEKGYLVRLEELVLEIEKRDYLDSTRKVDPLKPAEGAIILDCSKMNAEQVIKFILEKVS